MILDKSAKANKRTLLSKIADYVIDKLTTAVVSKLTTTDKTIPGAINELNSKLAFCETESIGKDESSTVDIPALCMNANYYGCYLVAIVPNNNVCIWTYFGILFQASNFFLREVQCTQMQIRMVDQNSGKLTITNLNKDRRTFKVGVLKIL